MPRTAVDVECSLEYLSILDEDAELDPGLPDDLLRSMYAHDCPVQVDIATYKSEFLAHYYEHRRRPRSHYGFGLIHRWARLGAAMPGLANFFSHNPVTAFAAKWAVGMAPQRAVPKLAKRTYRAQFEPMSPANVGRRVVLWDDTFNNHFRPHNLLAAQRVLTRAGFNVALPKKQLCCGRAMYDYGLLDQAKKLWQRSLDALQSELAVGTPIVSIEPSCVAAFRDELPGLMHTDERAAKLKKQVFTLAELLTKHDYAPPVRHEMGGGQAIVQTHCHQRAVLSTEPDRQLLERVGLNIEEPNDSCCGQAGSFGFERDKYDLSMTLGERKLFPAIRRADGPVVVADGFSCREHIEHGTGRVTHSLSELLDSAAST